MNHFISWWEKTVLLRPFDFTVLGAGLIGKQIAIKIKRKYPNSRVALIDRLPVPYGASTRNAGFACFGSVSEILDDLQRSSEADVYALLDKRYRGINLLKDEYGADQIGFRPTGSYEIFTDKDELNKALEAFAHINTSIHRVNGLQQVFTEKTTSGNGMQVLPVSLYNPYEGMLNSGMLNEAVSDTAHRLGILPMYGLEVTQIENLEDGVLLHTTQGIGIKTHQLIVANNAFASQLMPELDVVPARGQILVTEPLNHIPFDGIFHADKGYIYFRNLGNRILIGGGRNHFQASETTYDFDGSEALKQHLENYLRTVVIPSQSFSTQMHWSGIMAMGKEKIPLVKRLSSHTSICVRMSGMGVALGPVLSNEVAELME